MIANAIASLLGLFLAYSAIFASPAGQMDNIVLAITSAIIIVLAFLSWRMAAGRWQGGTNIALGVILLLLAIARWISTVSPSFAFWTIMLSGITISILALWAALYRVPSATPVAPR